MSATVFRFPPRLRRLESLAPEHLEPWLADFDRAINEICGTTAIEAPAVAPRLSEGSPMSILTQLANKQISLSQAWTEFEAWEQKLVSSNPALSAAASQTTTVLKTTASAIVGFAGTELEPLLTSAIPVIENAVDGLLSAATKGVSVAANPLINSGIDQLGSILTGLITTAVTSAKAALASS